MTEDRSWVAPAAFLAFAGILVAAIFSFLKMRGLLASGDGLALVTWLTLIVTGCAFAAALSALFIALKQIGHDETQATIASINHLKERIEFCSSIFLDCQHLTATINDIEIDIRGNSIGKLVNLKSVEEAREIVGRITKNSSDDYYMDGFPNEEIKQRIIGTANIILYNYRIILKERNTTYFEEETESIPKMTEELLNDYSALWDHTSEQASYLQKRIRTLATKIA